MIGVAPLGQVIFSDGVFHRSQFAPPFGVVRSIDSTTYRMNLHTGRVLAEWQSQTPHPWKPTPDRYGNLFQRFGGGQVLDGLALKWTSLGLYHPYGNGMFVNYGKGSAAAIVSSPNLPERYQQARLAKHPAAALANPMKTLLLALLLLLGRRAEAELTFFAMDTIARGAPTEVAPQVKDLGYAGIAGRLGDQPMAEAMRAAGLKFFGGYQVVQLNAEGPALDAALRGRIDRMQGHATAVWLGLHRIAKGGQPVPKAAPEAMEVALREVRTIADYAQSRGVRVALYPHAGFWLERVEEAVDLAERLSHPNLGVMFNLCHWLKMEGAERDPAPVLQQALPRLFFVTVSGADIGDTRKMPWRQLIQPLGSGTYDVAAFLGKLVKAGYSGPVGFQGYGIQEDPRTVMTATMAAWRRMNPRP